MIGALPGLGRDLFTIERQGDGGSDELGNPTAGEWTVLATNLPGALGTPTWRDQQSAAQQDIALDAVLATLVDLARRGDHVIIAGGRGEFEVIKVTRVAGTGHLRLALRSIEG